MNFVRYIAGDFGPPLLLASCILLIGAPVASQELRGPSLPNRVPRPEVRPSSPPPAPVPETDDTPPPTLSDLLTTILREAVPETYEDERNWGKTVRRWDGLQIRGFKTSRRWKDVNHGQWQRFRATLLSPDETLKLNVTQLPVTNPGSVPFLIQLNVRARCEATYAFWSYGVKGLNGTVVADATVDVYIHLVLAQSKDLTWGSLIPLLALRPQVADVAFRLRDLDVRKVSQLGGWAAETLGRGSEQAVETLMRRQEKKVQIKLQERLDRYATGKSR